MRFRLTKMVMQNFKAVHNAEYDLNSNKVIVSGGNATGKTTLYEAYYWCLFGKTVTPNGIVQTLDADNNVVHKVETSVELTLNINDEYTIVIKRTLNEKWKALGTAEERFDGNEVQRYWNGVPITMSKYKAKLNEIYPIEKWQLVSNIHTFMVMKMEDRRKYLISMSGNIDEQTLMKPYPEVSKAVAARKTIEELLAQTKSELKRAKKELDDIPTQIKAQDSLKVSIEDGGDTDAEQINLYYDEEKRLENEIDRKRKSLREEYDKDVRAKKNKLISAKDSLDAEKRGLAKLEENNSERVASLIKTTEEFEAKKAEWQKVNNEKFEFTSDDVCPVCGTKLSEEYKTKVRNKAVDEFNVNKSKRLEALMKEATTLSEKKAVLTGANNEYKEITKPEKEKAIKQAQEALDLAQESYDKAVVMDIETDTSLKALISQFEEWKKKKPANADNVLKVKADMEINRRVEAEKERLDKRSKELTIIIASCDKILAEIKAYKRAKIDLVESNVNKYFDLVRWKFYAQNVTNDDEQEICTCIVGGKDFVNLNDAMKINAQIDICNAIARTDDIFAPMWIDGAESVTDPLGSLSQQFLLRVVDNEKLSISL